MSIEQCNCTDPDELPTVPEQDCEEYLGQFLRLIFSNPRGTLLFDLGTPANNLPAAIVGQTPDTAAPWTTLEAASGVDKIAFTPLVSGDPAVTAGDVITSGGGDNTTANGRTEIVGENEANATFRFDNLSAEVSLALSELYCRGELRVFFVNNAKDIIGESKDGNLWQGFLCNNVYLNGRSAGQYAVKDSNTLTFNLDKDWYKYFKKVPATPPFNPLTF